MYQERYGALADKHEALKAKHAKVDAEIADKASRQENLKQFITALRQQEGLVREFDDKR